MNESTISLVCVSARRVRRMGRPDMSKVSTSFVERHNLTTRMTNRRMTRASSGYSKKLENHQHMMALTYFSYNYCRRHMTLRETPARAVGVADHRWSYEEVVELTDAFVKARQERRYENMFAIKFDLP